MDPADLHQLEQSTLLRGASLELAQHVMDACTIRTLDAGDTLLQPDVPNSHLHVVLSGELDVELVTREATRHTTIPVGGCAGEISLVDGKPPSARVVALCPTRILSLPHDAVWELVEGSHAVARNLLAILAGRMRNENRALVQSIDRSALYAHQATVDALTGLHNRRWMTEAFPRAAQRCAQSGLPCSVLLVDVDHFKRVNDTHGHHGGDAALRRVAEVLVAQLRPQDLVVRQGGEEFCILLPSTASADALAAAERIRAAVSGAAVRHAENVFSVTLSIGVTAWQADESMEAVLVRADRALYAAKAQGRDRVVMAD